MQNFNDLELNSTLLENLVKLGHTKPTPIQEKAIPVILSGKDILGIAQTGTGKTGAFALSILNLILSKPGPEKWQGPRALIIAPTRELCLQINEAIEVYSKNTGVKSTAIFGGVDQTDQVKAIREKVDILVATPGRLLDLISQKLLRISTIEFFVLDEADRMFDLGFIEDINEIISLVPVTKQTMLFSATMAKEINALAEKVLKNHETIEAAPESTVAVNIDQKVIYCKREHKFQLLKKILKEEREDLAIVFTRTKEIADNVVEYLAKNRIASKALHGDKKQDERSHAVKLFKDKSIKVLIATDIASRGIDIDGIGHVINFDLPQEPETYVHRIGRTARAGASGIAISFCDSTEVPRLEKIQEHIKEFIKSEKFEGKFESLKFGAKKVTAPTPGKSQEKNAWLDQSRKEPLMRNGKVIKHPGFKKMKKRK